MKNLMKTSLWCLVGMTLLLSPAMAGSGDKTTEKARTAVNNAAPDDWETLAKSAQLCIKKKVNLAEAKQWLDKSLELKESPLGYEVAGDYYMVSKLYDKAINNYVKSMQLKKGENGIADLSHLQAKIEAAGKS